MINLFGGSDSISEGSPIVITYIFYMFPKLTRERWAKNDKQFVLDLLHEEHVLLVHGSGFSREYGSGHVRLVFLPGTEILEEAFDRINRFMK